MKARWFANLVLTSGALVAGVGAVLVSPAVAGSGDFSLRHWAFLAALLVLAALFLLALRLPLSTRIGTAVTLISVASGVYALEATLRWRIASRVSHAARTLGYPYDSRTRLDVLLDLRRSGEEAWPTVFAASLLGEEKSLLLLPLGGISRVTTVHCNEIGPYLIYRSDEHGFHNPPGLWNLPRMDVALLGDSFMQGNCVGSDQNAAARIRTDYPATLNLGIQGNGPLLELAGLEEYLPELKPKRVVWLFCEDNDLVPDLAVESRSPLLKKYLEPGYRQGLAHRQEEVDAFWRHLVSGMIDERTARLRSSRARWDAVQGWLRLRTLRAMAGLRLAAGRSFSGANYDLLERILREARDCVSAWGGKLWFAYLPSQEDFGHGPFTLAGEPVRPRILGILDGLHIPVIDLGPVFARQPDIDSLYASPGAHLSPRGYELLGRTIADALKGKEE